MSRARILPSLDTDLVRPRSAVRPTARRIRTGIFSPAFRVNARPWLAGLALAVAGVVLTRLVAPDFSARPRAALALAGELLALAGLLVIALGIRRRLLRSTDDAVTNA